MIRPNPWVVLAGTTLVAAGMAWSFWQGQKFERGQQALDEQKLQAVEDRALQVTAEAISKIRITNRTIYQETQREVFHNPVYADCRVPPDGLQLLNAAIEGLPVTPSGGGVPAAPGAP